MNSEECIHGLTPGTCSLCKQASSPFSNSQRAKSRLTPTADRKTPENSADFFGHPWPEWFHMCDIATDYILEGAAIGRTRTYGDLWSAVEEGLGKPIGNAYYQRPHLLEWTTRRFAVARKLMLSALVVRDAEDPGPGAGFFRLAAELGLLHDDAAPKAGEPWLAMSSVQRDFWERQRNGLFSLWK